MTIFIGADHRGFELKNSIIEYLQEKNIRIEDLGNYENDKNDDYPDYAQKVAQAVQQNLNDFLGIVICGSGIGVCIAANRYKKILCGLGFDEQQVKHSRENDHINILALASDSINLEKAEKLVDTFINTAPVQNEKYLRRINKIDNSDYLPSHLQ